MLDIYSEPLVIDVEIYSDERIAEFLLSTAIDDADYQNARSEVEALGLDPGAIPHCYASNKTR